MTRVHGACDCSLAIQARADKRFSQFVVDGEWITDHTAPQETDEHNNINNVLLPEEMTTKPPSGAFVSGVTPQSTTAALAGQVPKESGRGAKDSPPETPFHDAQEFSVNPIPASSGIGNPITLRPGEKVPDPSTFTKTKDPQEFGVNPIPASSGIGNPVNLRPGEKVPDPSTFTKNTVDSTVTTDKASYENGPTAPKSSDAPPAIAGGAFGVLPPVSKSTIPESSLPMGSSATSGGDPALIQSAGAGSTTAALAGQVPKEPRGVPQVVSDEPPSLQSAGAGSTTAALAGQVPKEPRGVPHIVSESQEEAGVGPEASANAEAVKEKSAVEQELEKKIPEEAPTTEGSKGASTGKLHEGESSCDIFYAETIILGTAIAPTVPDTVQKSIAEANMSPEAAADTTEVAKKGQVESELLKSTSPTEQSGTPAPSNTAATSETAPTTAPSTTAASGPDKARLESRDISPLSHPTGGPSVTTGVSSGPTPTKSTATNSSASASAEKKSKRSSGFFGKLKAKFDHKDKDKK